jgi:hypothetical protein
MSSGYVLLGILGTATWSSDIYLQFVEAIAEEPDAFVLIG